MNPHERRGIKLSTIVMPTSRGITELFPDLSERSEESELIDSPDSLSDSEMGQMLTELSLVNRWLGGRRTLMKLACPVLERVSADLGRREILVADLGSGGSDLSRSLVDWSRSKGIQIRIVAVDFSHSSNRLARKSSTGYPEIEVVTGDVRALPIREVQVSLCAAFLHHFGASELQGILTEIRTRTTHAILVSDLERNLLAYWGIVSLAKLLSRSGAVKNDGPLSVRRGFREHELRDILESAFGRSPVIRRSWAFRLSCILEFETNSKS